MKTDISRLQGRVLGHYQILSLLGEGGMGVVYKAHQMSLNRTVALKILSPDLSSDASFVKRFKREAQAVARLNHPNIIQIYDIEEDEGFHLFSMEYVNARTLADVVKEEAPLAVDRACRIAFQIARAIRHAHKHEILHRDIKPSNILVSDLGTVKVMDFGLARIASENTKLTQTGMIIGTVDYMSPEQCRGEDIDFRTDVYSLGAVMYEMLTARKLFDVPDVVALINKIINEEPQDIQTLNPSVPAKVADVVARALAKDKEHRYPSMSRFLQKLAPFQNIETKSPVRKQKKVRHKARENARRKVRRSATEDLALTEQDLRASPFARVKNNLFRYLRPAPRSIIISVPVCFCLVSVLYFLHPARSFLAAVGADVTNVLTLLRREQATIRKSNHLASSRGQTGKGIEAKRDHAEAGIDLNSVAAENDIDILSSSSGEEIDLDARDTYGRTVLLKAASVGDTGGVKAFLAMGADKNARDRYGRTALILAAANGHADTASFLLKNGLDINAMGKYGETSLMEAGARGFTDVVNTLVRNGADVNATNSQGETAMMYAARRGQTLAVKTLLENGAYPDAQNNAGWTALMVALRHKDTVELLVEQGADVNARDKAGESAVMKAAQEGYCDAARILLRRTTDADIKNEALEIAEHYGHTDIVRLFDMSNNDE